MTDGFADRLWRVEALARLRGRGAGNAISEAASLGAALRRLLSAVAFLAMALAAMPAAAQGAGPDNIVRLLYQHYIDTTTGLVFAFDYTDPVVASNYFDPALARFIVADARDGDPRLDFDPFVNGQDFDIKAVELETHMLSDDTAEVVASFKNFDEAESHSFTLVRTKRGWRIADVHLEGEETSLRDFLAASR